MVNQDLLYFLQSIHFDVKNNSIYNIILFYGGRRHSRSCYCYSNENGDAGVEIKNLEEKESNWVRKNFSSFASPLPSEIVG